MDRCIVRSGRWLYGGSAYQPVTIVSLDWDFWYAIGEADDRLEPGEVPHLNQEGVQYYVCFKGDPKEVPGWVDSPGHDSIEAAATWAQSQVETPIEWFSPAT